MESFDVNSVQYKEVVGQYGQSLQRASQMGSRFLCGTIMENTDYFCKCLIPLQKAIESTKEKQFLSPDKDGDEWFKPNGSTERIVMSDKRTFEAAKAYQGKKVAALNFASAFHVGGSPFTARAQEECLCHVSTLYPCLKTMEGVFHKKHQEQRQAGLLDEWANADLIYHPGIIVFKKDAPLPRVLKQEQWYFVNVLTCAAPNLRFGNYEKTKYIEAMRRRIEHILYVAEKQGNEVLILGAFGCGVFQNPPEIVARLFQDSLTRHRFETVEFAVYDPHPFSGGNIGAFQKVFGK